MENGKKKQRIEIQKKVCSYLFQGDGHLSAEAMGGKRPNNVSPSDIPVYFRKATPSRFLDVFLFIKCRKTVPGRS